MKINSIQKNQNFQARLDISGIKLNKKKAGEVQKLFEKKTARYNHDTLYVYRKPVNDLKGRFQQPVALSSESGDIGFFTLTVDFKRIFNNFSANELAKQFVRFYKEGVFSDIQTRVAKAVADNKECIEPEILVNIIESNSENTDRIYTDIQNADLPSVSRAYNRSFVNPWKSNYFFKQDDDLAM